jgi:hypothetical protein
MDSVRSWWYRAILLALLALFLILNVLLDYHNTVWAMIDGLAIIGFIVIWFFKNR